MLTLGIHDLPFLAGGSLLRGLISYWKLDEVGPGARADSFGSHPLADKTGDLSSAAGIINLSAGHFGEAGTTTNGALWVADNAELKMGAGKSFTIAGWTNAAGSGSNNRTMGGKWGSVIGSQEFTVYTAQSADTFFYVWASFIENGTTQKNIDGFAGAGGSFRNFASAWRFYAYGYDAVHQLGFLKVVNTGPVVTLTVPCTNILGTTSDFVLGNTAAYASAHWGWLDETGFWNRVLSDSELKRLWNAGSGLPLSSFH
jgi:hypothetical protein